MKKALPILCFVLLFVAGCGGQKHVALKVDAVEISPTEFETAFQESRYANMGERGRSIFLEQYIDTKLILLEAERMGLDKDPEFLKDVQHFWEQALLKRVIAEKSEEFAEKIKVTEEEARNYYEKNKATGFQGKSFDEVEDQVRWVFLKIKQSQALSAWTEDLRKKADIKINRALLGMNK